MIKNGRSYRNETPFKAAQITPEIAQKNPTILPNGVQGTASPQPELFLFEDIYKLYYKFHDYI